MVIAVAGGLSAVLVNDIIVFAMTPMLCAGLQAGNGRRPEAPTSMALAGAGNAGSAATLIGNPQNILIGQARRPGLLAFPGGGRAASAYGAGLCVYVGRAGDVGARNWTAVRPRAGEVSATRQLSWTAVQIATRR